MIEAAESGTSEPFTLTHRGTRIEFGRGSVTSLGTYLQGHGLERAMVVCGRSTAVNRALMEAVSTGADGRVAGVFDGVRPSKQIATVYAGIAHAQALGADAVIGLGGGSSLDTARQISVYRADGRTLLELRDQALNGQLKPFEFHAHPLPVVVVPTTFAGADLSPSGTMEILAPTEAPSGLAVRAAGRLRPAGAWFDPALFETAPSAALANSAMNGFDKGLETIYAADASAFSDAVATHGLRLMQRGFLAGVQDSGAAMDTAVAGLVLVQLERRTSIIHAFGRAVSYGSDIQQGVAHGIFAPPVLRYILEVTDARRHLLAAGLGLDTGGAAPAELADAIVDAVTAVRDALGLPRSLHEVMDPTDLDPAAFAARVIGDGSRLRSAPAGVALGEADAARILEAVT